MAADVKQPVQPDRPVLRKDAQRNRERIVGAARDLFAERGLGEGLNEVARRAGVGVGTVYRNFADKQALVDAVFEDRLDEFFSLHEQAEAAPDGWAALRTWMELQLEVATRDRGMHDLLNAGPDAHRVATRMAERLDPVADRIVARAQAEGTLRDDVGRSDLVVVNVMLTLLLRSTDELGPEQARRLLDLLLEGLRARPGQAPLTAAAPTDAVLHAVLASSPQTTHPLRPARTGTL